MVLVIQLIGLLIIIIHVENNYMVNSSNFESRQCANNYQLLNY